MSLYISTSNLFFNGVYIYGDTGLCYKLCRNNEGFEVRK